MFLFREFTLDINKELRASLKNIFGVGWYKSNLVTSKLGLASSYYLADINLYNFALMFFLLKNLVISDVRIKRKVESNINKKIDLNSYSGVRHKLCLPYVVKELVQMRVLSVISVFVCVHLVIVKKFNNGFS